jgi:hypothetical protein
MISWSLTSSDTVSYSVKSDQNIELLSQLGAVFFSIRVHRLTFETRILAIMHSSIDLQELEDESREVEEEFKKRSPNRSMKRLTRRTGGLTPTGP